MKPEYYITLDEGRENGDHSVAMLFEKKGVHVRMVRKLTIPQQDVIEQLHRALDKMSRKPAPLPSPDFPFALRSNF